MITSEIIIDYHVIASTFYKFLCKKGPGVLGSKPLCGSKFDLVFHPSKTDQVSARNFFYKKCPLEVVEPHVKKIGHLSFSFNFC